ERRAVRILAELGERDREAVHAVEDRRALGDLDRASVDREPHGALMITRTLSGTRPGPRGRRAAPPGRGRRAKRPGSPRRARPRGDDAPGRPAHDGGADRPLRRGAAAERLEQRAERAAELELDDPGATHVARDAEELGPAAAAEAREPGAALGDDRRHRAERL